MRSLAAILALMFISPAIHGQSPSGLDSVYTWDYVIKYVRKNKMDATRATNAIIREITQQYEGEGQQIELVRFYRDAYDFKIIDKSILSHIIDSLANNGSTANVTSLAKATRQLVLYRILNKEIRNFVFPDKDGKLISLSSLRLKIVIIELWATWCAPCVKEMKKIPELRRTNSNIEFYSISLDKSADKMNKFIDTNNYQWPIVFGGDERINKALWNYLNIVAIPKYYFVDRNGIVIEVADTLDENYIRSLK